MKVTRFGVLLAVIILLAAFYRLYQLGSYPQHFDNDESVLAYDAWSIWLTGADHHGARFPNHFRTFNEYIPGLAQYIAAPFVGLLGLNEFNARLPFALMGIATVLLTALIGRRWLNETAGLIAALLLATEPWHVTFSRLSLVNSSVPFFTVLSLYLFTYTVDKFSSGMRLRRLLIWITLSALSFALLTRTYQPLKLEAPLLFAGCLIALLFRGRGNWRLIGLWIGFYCLFSSPQWIDQLVHFDLYQVQFEHNNIFSLDNWPIIFLRHYYSQYDLSRLFVDGFGGGQSIHPVGIGQLFWLEVFLWLVGIVGLAKQRLIGVSGFSLSFLLGWWFLIWPIAAAVTVSGVPTETRTVNFLPLPELLAGYGAAILLNEARERSGILKRAIIYSALGAASLIYISYNVYFLSEFFSSNSYPSMTEDEIRVLPYNIGLEPVLQAVIPLANDCDAIWLDNWGNSQPYIYYLFFTKYPPAKYQAAVKYEMAMPPVEFNHVSQFGNVRVAVLGTIIDPNTAPFIPPSCSASEHTFLIVHQKLMEPDLYEIASSKSSSGATIWAAYLKTNPKPN